MEILYFGTSLNEKGHYIYNFGSVLRGRTLRHNLPFDPESLVMSSQINGTVNRINYNDYKIIAIAGSCTDDRAGSKSIFITKNFEDGFDFEEYLKQHPLAIEMFSQMKFKINW